MYEIELGTNFSFDKRSFHTNINANNTTGQKTLLLNANVLCCL